MKINGISTVTTNTSASTFNINFQVPYRLATNTAANTIQRQWEFFNVVNRAPSQTLWQASYGNSAIIDGMHVVVVDDGGLFSGTPGTVLETYVNVSRATDAENADGTNNYYPYVINQNSQYIHGEFAQQLQ